MPTMPRGMCPLVTSYTTGAAGGVDSTDLEGGFPRTALAYERGVQTFNVALFLTPLMFSVWNTFFHHAIKKGAITFTMPLDSGYGVQDHVVTMVAGSYSTARSGGIHTVVTFQVLAENKAYEMTAADAEALLELYEEYGERSDALLARLAQFANVDTLVLDF